MAPLECGRAMERVESGPIAVYSSEQLLGPLNDIERKHSQARLFVAGKIEIPLPRPRVAIVGSRQASPKGLETARSIARILANEGAIIVSGLAAGVDAAAHSGAIDAGGRTIAVLGTPLNRSFPAKNGKLQQLIMREHLAVSQFPIGHETLPRDFVLRNRTMALIANASIIVEAGEGSGSLSQGWEALRLGRPLFIWKSILENDALKWPREMLEYGAIALEDPEATFEYLPPSETILSVTQ
jgi:DNA processing protein